MHGPRPLPGSARSRATALCGVPGGLSGPPTGFSLEPPARNSALPHRCRRSSTRAPQGPSRAPRRFRPRVQSLARTAARSLHPVPPLRGSRSSPPHGPDPPAAGRDGPGSSFPRSAFPRLGQPIRRIGPPPRLVRQGRPYGAQPPASPSRKPPPVPQRVPPDPQGRRRMHRPPEALREAPPTLGRRVRGGPGVTRTPSRHTRRSKASVNSARGKVRRDRARGRSPPS